MTKQEILNRIDELIHTNSDLKATDFNPLLKEIVTNNRPYKSYSALLTTNFGVLDVVELENSLGVDVTWRKIMNGYFEVSFSESLPDIPIVEIGTIMHSKTGHTDTEHGGSTKIETSFFPPRCETRFSNNKLIINTKQLELRNEINSTIKDGTPFLIDYYTNLIDNNIDAFKNTFIEIRVYPNNN